MNMTPEYRRELRHLTKIENKMGRDLVKVVRDNDKAKKEIDRRTLKAVRNTDREMARVARRRAILEGRL
jgi:hypothetical protein